MAKQKKFEIPEEYCEECGRKLMYMGTKGAENFGVWGYKRSSKYDKETGKRNLVHWMSCPRRVELRKKSEGRRFLRLLFTFGLSTEEYDFQHDAHCFGDII